MNKTFLLFLLLLPLNILAQPVIKHAEDFTIGEKLIFLVHNAPSISPGAAGSNRTWDFSTVSTEDSSIELMLKPSSTTHGKDFPNANYTEAYSNGSYVYVNKTPAASYLVGYLDTTTSGINIKYPNSVLFALRPIRYGDKVTDSFTVNGTVAGNTYSGKGTNTIYADGYGTLKLPNGTYNNVLRIKLSQQQQDTAGGFPFTIKEVSYTWFDSLHHSALLKIDSISRSVSVTMTLSYLEKETTGIEDANYKSLHFAARIFDGRLLINELPVSGNYAIHIYNIKGQEVFTKPDFVSSPGLHTLDLPHLSQGTYIISLAGNNSSGQTKVINP